MIAVGRRGSIRLVAALGRTALPLVAVLALAGCAATTPDTPRIATGPSEPGLDGVRLVGLGGSDLEGLLGRPALLRSEQRAQYWRYTLGRCQLDLFLYAERDAGPARVVYLDARPAGDASPERAATCARLRSALRGEPPPPPLAARAQSIGLPADGSY